MQRIDRWPQGTAERAACALLVGRTMPGVGAAAWLALQAHLPADILWENMSTRFFSRVLRVMFTWLCTVVLLLLSATIIYLMQNAERNAGSTHACGSVIMVTTACTALRDGDYMALATCFADGRALGQRAFLNATTGVNYVVECSLVDCYECHCGAPATGAPSLLTTPTCRPYLLGVAKDSAVRCASDQRRFRRALAARAIRSIQVWRVDGRGRRQHRAEARAAAAHTA